MHSSRDPRALLMMLRATIVLMVVAATPFFAMSACPCPAEEPLSVLAEFETQPRGDFLTVPVAIGGQIYPFALDTATSGCIIDTSLRRFLGAPTEKVLVRGLNVQAGAVRYAVPKMYLAEMPIILPRGALCVDIHEDFKTVGQNIYGILGVDFLQDKVFRIDFDRGKVQFLRQAREADGERLDLRWKDGVPHAIIAVDGAGNEDFAIGTAVCGFNSGSLRMPLFLRLVASGRLKPISDGVIEGYSPFDEAPSTDYLATLDRFDLGRFNHVGLIFGHSARNVLGLAYLSRYLVTFDLAHSAIYLKPGNAYARRDTYDLAGVSIARRGSKTILADVEAGRPGAIAGIAEGDELREVDGRSARSTSVFELCRVFATPGRHIVRIVGKEDGAPRELTLVLQDHAGADQLRQPLRKGSAGG